MDGAEILHWQELVREVILAEHVQDYIVRLMLATHPNGQFAPPITNQYIRWGASPRAAQTLALAAKVRALLDGRYNVSFEDVRRVFSAGHAAPHHRQFRGPGRRHRARQGARAVAGKSAGKGKLSYARNFTPTQPRTARPAGKDGAGQPQDLPRADEGRAAQPAQGAERRVRRLPQLRARRRPAVRRLEHLRPAGEALPQDVPGGGGPALLRPDRRQHARWISASRPSCTTPCNWPPRWGSSGWCGATG